jgi:hypothetical protein
MLDPRNIHRTRRKTLAIYVNTNGEIIVKAPMRISDAQIFDFVKSKSAWITSRQKQIMQNKFIDHSITSYSAYLFLGKKFIPIITEGQKTIGRGDGVLYIPAKFRSEIIPKKIEKYFRESAKAIIGERVDYFSRKLNLVYGLHVINNNKTRWGACSRSADLAFNWRAVMLPPDLLDYLIVHEFCHILEFNHTAAFWAIVETILPDFRDRRKHLKSMNWLLSLFRGDL